MISVETRKRKRQDTEKRGAMIKRESKENAAEVPDDIKAEMKAELGYDSSFVIDSDDEKRLDDMPELKRE